MTLTSFSIFQNCRDLRACSLQTLMIHSALGRDPPRGRVNQPLTNHWNIETTKRIKNGCRFIGPSPPIPLNNCFPDLSTMKLLCKKKRSLTLLFLNAQIHREVTQPLGLCFRPAHAPSARITRSVDGVLSCCSLLIHFEYLRVIRINMDKRPCRAASLAFPFLCHCESPSEQLSSAAFSRDVFMSSICLSSS